MLERLSDSIVFPDGGLASLPRATCELQGYAYDARIRTARLAREVWHDDATAERLERDAANLKATFNTDFGWTMVISSLLRSMATNTRCRP